MLFSDTDEKDLAAREMTPAELINVIYRFTHQTATINLDRPCNLNDGIVQLPPAQALELSETFNKESRDKTMIKFVPASGAATRMFNHLIQYDPQKVTPLVEELVLNFDLFPFYKELKTKLESHNLQLESMISENKWEDIIQFLLYSPGLDFAKFPKGLIPFHKYKDGTVRTAFEEHMHEAVDYGRETDGTCRIHFTLAPHQIELVMNFLEEKSATFPYEKFILNHSIQKSNTDTPAIDRHNQFVRDKAGHIIFRPAGHGALIHNLQELDEDIIFIKNIDNVTTEDQKHESIFYKKVLAGMLLELKKQADHYLGLLEQNDRSVIDDAIIFIKKWFQPTLPNLANEANLVHYIKLQLDRPMRVCGMVKNEGEPGGGPFWVKMSDGFVSKQIVEKSQVDPHNLQQMKVLSTSTHFNPVDIVCTIKNRFGKKYHLNDYIDHSTGFISEKFVDGNVIKALELPGLWNGSMALWNTVFVEVPVSTFNPVKTVNDLLRPGHQTA
jgi:hypothetical protein